MWCVINKNAHGNTGGCLTNSKAKLFGEKPTHAGQRLKAKNTPRFQEYSDEMREELAPEPIRAPNGS